MRMAILAAAILALAGCGGGGGGGGSGGGGGGGGGGGAATASPLLVVAGAQAVTPVERGPWADGVDLDRLGLDPSDIDAYYDLTTPAGTPFLFEVVSRRAGNAGDVLVSVAHAADDGNRPTGGAESIARVGIVPSGSGTTAETPWLRARGDGFGRMGFRGTVDRDQVLVVGTRAGRRESLALVRVAIGPESAINLAALTGGDYPGVKDVRTVYSSNSWMFGLPTVAVSGDRTTMIVYEGDRANPDSGVRYEMRLQHEAGTGLVTGGASEEASSDSGYWRDHEVAALFNTLALVRSGADDVTVRLSFDRGATFAQTEVLDRAQKGWSPRLVQIAMAADYTLAVALWRTVEEGTTELRLVRGRPSAFDGGGSPTAFVFDPALVLRSVSGDVTPLLTGLAWSSGGDLVVGYGFTSFTSGEDGTWRSDTQNRCAVLPWAGEATDVLVEQDTVVGKDPSVAVLGAGDTLRVFFAYEAADGVRLRVSDDGGRTFGGPVRTDDASTAVPTVVARDVGGLARVDLLYLAQGEGGQELHILHWDDYDGTTPAPHRLTRAVFTESASVPRGGKVPGAALGILAPDYGFRVTEVAWFGYDAVVDGDDLVVVYDESTYDAVIYCGDWRGGPERVSLDGGVPQAGGADFIPAEPPPLAPGLTEPVSAPDPSHMHQLKVLRLR